MSFKEAGDEGDEVLDILKRDPQPSKLEPNSHVLMIVGNPSSAHLKGRPLAFSSTECSANVQPDSLSFNAIVPPLAPDDPKPIESMVNVRKAQSSTSNASLQDLLHLTLEADETSRCGCQRECQFDK